MKAALPAAGLARFFIGLVQALVLACLPALAEARACADPDEVAAVVRLLSDRLGLLGALTLDHIRRIPTDTATGGPICEAEVEGIRAGPEVLGQKLDMVRYWDEITAGAPSVGARLMPRSDPAELVDSASAR